MRLTAVLLMIGLAVAGTAAPAKPHGAAPVRPSLTIEPYPFKLRDGSILAAERGRFEVAEQRAARGSRKISIGFVRFRSTNPHPGPPIVYLAGGPGGSGVDAARGVRQPIFLALRAAGDVIALDQRGVGLSNAVPSCTADAPLDPAGGLSEATLTAYHRQTLVKCAAMWRAAGVALGGYSTQESADDLEDLRRALGVPKLRLWAISYGTHLALATMRRHPGAIERVVLSSAEGMDQTVKLPAHVDAALGRIGHAVGRDDLTALMRRVHARLDAAPLAMTASDSGRTVRFTTDSFALRTIAAGAAKDPSGARQLVRLYGAFDAGQGGALAPLIYNFFLKQRLEMTGMPELMDLASGISGPRLSQVRREAADSIVGAATNFPMPQLRGAVPGIDLGDRYRREVRSAIPTLLFSGDLDPRTPLEEQAVATAGLTRLTRIRVHNGGHDLYEAHPDIPAAILAFFTGRPIDAAVLSLPSP